MRLKHPQPHARGAHPCLVLRAHARCRACPRRAGGGRAPQPGEAAGAGRPLRGPRLTAPTARPPPAQPQPVRAAAGGDVAERRWRFESGAGAMDGSGPQGQGQGQPGRAADPRERAEEAKPGEGPGRSCCGRGGCRWRSRWERVNGSARTPWLLGTRVRCQAGVCGCRLAKHEQARLNCSGRCLVLWGSC